MRFFKRIKNEGIRRIFIIASICYMIFQFFSLLKTKTDLYDAAYKAYLKSLQLGFDEVPPSLFYNAREVFDYIAVFAILSVGGILLGYLGILVVQWAYEGFKKS